MQRLRDKPGTPPTVCYECTPVAAGATANSLHLNSLEHSETEAVLVSLARLLEQRDKHTAAHSERLACTAVAVGIAMQLDSETLRTLYVGGSLHDIGKIGIPDSILLKPVGLTQEEWRTMRSHPVLGEEICRPLPALRAALPLIRHHHERWDGSGYPDGLRGSDIPLLARILQVVDIYDALTNPRCYRGASSSARALEILQEETDRGWRDPELTALFVGMHVHGLPESSRFRELAHSPVDSMDASLRSLQTYVGR
jgi:putative two-component system response regulator